MRSLTLALLAVATIGGTALAEGHRPSRTEQAEDTLVAMYNGTSGSPFGYEIGAAVRGPEDPGWVRSPSNPVLRRGPDGAWDDEQVKDQWLVHDGTQYVLYYAGSADGYPQYQIGRATSASVEGPWKKDASNPVLTHGAIGTWDDEAVLFPVVVYEPGDTGREWKMWHTGSDGTTQRIGYAYSTDGVSWTRHGQVVDVGAKDAWNSYWLVTGSIVRDQDAYHLFIGGAQHPTNPRWQGGHWTFTDPQGAYEPHPLNPILRARFQESGTHQALTDDTAASSGSVSVASTSAFSAGEPVVLADSDSETHVTAVTSIDSVTRLTIADPAPSDFTVNRSAVLRPLTYNSVYPRTVIPAAGRDGWDMYLVAHQPVIDIPTGGVTLREATMKATAIDIAGPWVYDYVEGMLFPLAAPGARWDAIAAENVTVIPGTIQTDATGH